MYTLYMLQGMAPFVGALCLENFLYRQGELCNFRDYKAPVVQYHKPDPNESCYKDGIFYPRCKDLENPEVLSYHNMFLQK